MPPLHHDQAEKEIDQTFEASELLFRRVDPAELNSKGEVDPPFIASVSFGKKVEGAPSVVRQKYSEPEDVLHADCADQKDVSSCMVFFVPCDGLPSGLVSGDHRVFDFIPHHNPNPTCYAHTVIKSVIRGDESRTYLRPSGAVQENFKVAFAQALKPFPEKGESSSQLISPQGNQSADS